MRTALWILGAWLGAHVALIAASIVEVAVYSLVIAPGQPEAAYHAHAEQTAPWVSVVLGGPVFYGVGRLLLAKTGARWPAWAAWGAYTALDFAVVLAVGGTSSIWAIWTLSQSLKAAGVALATTRARATATA
jgi:hypothetical protein